MSDPEGMGLLLLLVVLWCVGMFVMFWAAGR